MADKIQSSDIAGAELPPGANPDGSVAAPQTNDPKSIFEERIALFTQHFQDLCKAEGVTTAVVLIADPKITGGPLLWKIGDNFSVARLMAQVLRKLKQRLFSELDA